MGNRLQRQDSAAGTTDSTFNHANMLLTAGDNSDATDATDATDADGNTLTGAGRTLTWDSQNQMIAAQAPSSPERVSGDEHGGEFFRCKRVE